MSKAFPITPHRTRILEILAEGDIRAEDGQATRLLMEKTGHQTTNALSGVLQQMEQGGVIRRETAGRRTYFIGLTAAGRKMLNNGQRSTPPASDNHRPTPVSDRLETDYAAPSFDETDPELLQLALLVLDRATAAIAREKEISEKLEATESQLLVLQDQLEQALKKLDLLGGDDGLAGGRSAKGAVQGVRQLVEPK